MRAERERPTAWGLPAAEAAAILAAAGAAAALAAIVLIAGDSAWMRGINGTLPIVVGATCFWSGYRMVRLRPIRLWTPFPWFLAAWSAYYGLGPLAYIYGTPETVAYMDLMYPVDQRALLRTNLLNTVGLAAVISGYVLASRVRLGSAVLPGARQGHDPWRVAMLFLLIGVPVKYLFELPYTLRLVDYVLPGSVQYLGTFSGLAILPLSVAAAEGRRGSRLLLWVLVAAELTVGLVMLSKLHIIMTVLLVFLGQYAVRPNLKRLVATGVVIAIAYVLVLSPFVNYARLLFGRASAQGVAEFTHAAAAYQTEGHEVMSDVLPNVQGWWSRLAYPNAQAFAMDQYDQGKAGWTFAMVGHIFMPRFLYPDKPIMTPGHDFTYLIQGTYTSSTGVGFVGEAYWNGGWLAVVLVGAFVGILFAMLGRVSANAVRFRHWLYAPLIFKTIYLGLRPDDWFVPSYVSGVLQTVLVTLLLGIMFSAMVRRRASSGTGGSSIRSAQTVCEPGAAE